MERKHTAIICRHGNCVKQQKRGLGVRCTGHDHLPGKT